MAGSKLNIGEAQRALKEAEESIIDAAIDLIDPVDWAEDQQITTGQFWFADNVELARRFLNLRDRVHYRDIVLNEIAEASRAKS